MIYASRDKMRELSALDADKAPRQSRLVFGTGIADVRQGGHPALVAEEVHSLSIF